MWREIYGCGDYPGRGAGDYLAVTANFGLFQKKMFPALREVFIDLFGLGRYWSGTRTIELRPNTATPFIARRADDAMWGRIMLGSAEAGGGLESTTAKAAWLDEAGMDSFTGETWRAVQSRLTLALGRCLITTTLYNFGYLKADFYDLWKAGDKTYDVVHFDSVLNPRFAREEWERLKKTLQPWRFAMRFQGRFERPAGMIYDSFVDEPYPKGHILGTGPIPPHWQRYVGLDFGGVNTAATFWAHMPGTRIVVCYREYKAGGRTAKEHVTEILKGEPRVPVCFGGSMSEGQWRDEFFAAGLLVNGPDVHEVEIQIARVYGAFKLGYLLIQGHCKELLKQVRSYSRKLDKAGEVTEDINKCSRVI